MILALPTDAWTCIGVFLDHASYLAIRSTSHRLHRLADTMSFAWNSSSVPMDRLFANSTDAIIDWHLQRLKDTDWLFSPAVCLIRLDIRPLIVFEVARRGLICSWTRVLHIARAAGVRAWDIDGTNRLAMRLGCRSGQVDLVEYILQQQPALIELPVLAALLSLGVDVRKYSRYIRVPDTCDGLVILAYTVAGYVSSNHWEATHRLLVLLDSPIPHAFAEVVQKHFNVV